MDFTVTPGEMRYGDVWHRTMVIAPDELVGLSRPRVRHPGVPTLST